MENICIIGTTGISVFEGNMNIVNVWAYGEVLVNLVKLF